MNQRRIGSAMGVAASAILVWLLMPGQNAAPPPSTPTSTSTPAALPTREPPKERSFSSARVAPEKPQRSEMRELKHNGDHELPSQNQFKNQQPGPTGVSFNRMASQMGSYFPIMDQPPETKGEEKLYHHYDKKMNAMLHLDGDRANLNIIHMTLFDRVNAPAARLETQAEMLRHFVAGAFKDSSLSLGTEIEAFLSTSTPGSAGPPKLKSWTVGSNILKVSAIDGSGMVTLTVMAAEQT